MTIQVKSEIGRLKKVLLHRPGGELEHLTPEYLSQLLFDDIPFLSRAQQEHDAFANALKDNDVEVVYLCDLVAQALDTDPWLRAAFVKEFLDNAGNKVINRHKELANYLLDIENTREFVLKTMEGILDSELAPSKNEPLVNLTHSSEGFIIDPIPNLYFTRDPMASIGNGVALNHMSRTTRQRETIYMKYVLMYHPDFRESVKTFYTPDMPYNIEGGDILNLTAKTLAVGLSERTSAQAIQLLAKNLFSDPDCEIENILALTIPNARAFMHLDTVLTQADTDAFLIHPAIIHDMQIFRVFRGCKGNIKAEALKGSLDNVLAKYMGLDHVRLIKCGGENSIAASREQWNDASNVLCIAPGKVIVYDRNTITNEILHENGIETVQIPSSELSRGRGGPRCMSMPLFRSL